MCLFQPAQASQEGPCHRHELIRAKVYNLGVGAYRSHFFKAALLDDFFSLGPFGAAKHTITQGLRTKASLESIFCRRPYTPYVCVYVLPWSL